jgi:hypothetical protein
MKSTGQAFAEILPPISMFGKDRVKKKQTVFEKLRAFFEKYLGI